MTRVCRLLIRKTCPPRSPLPVRSCLITYLLAGCRLQVIHFRMATSKLRAAFPRIPTYGTSSTVHQVRYIKYDTSSTIHQVRVITKARSGEMSTTAFSAILCEELAVALQGQHWDMTAAVGLGYPNSYGSRPSGTIQVRRGSAGVNC